MSTEKTEPQAIDTTSNPISKVESRMVPKRAVAPPSLEPRLTQARRTFAGLVAAAGNPPLRLKAEFDLVGVGRLRTASLDHFALVDDPGTDGGFTLSYEYHGREPLKHVCESERVYATLRKKLFDLSLRVNGTSSATASKLTIEPVVPASVSFVADRPRDIVQITLRNVLMLGQTTYDFPSETVDRHLIDAVIQLVTTHGREFYTLASRAGSQRSRR